jgi:hypothetical protein
MTIYSFKCFEDEGGCGHEFEVNMSPYTYKSEQSCPLCRKKSCVHRNYIEDGVEAQVRLSDSEVKTVGHLAARNTEKMKDDELNNRETAQRPYLKERSQKGKLPSGMRRFDPQAKFRKEKPVLDFNERLKRSKELKQAAKEKAQQLKEERRKGNLPTPKKQIKVVE